MPRLISIEGFAGELKIDVKEAKSILRYNPEMGVKIKGFRAKMIDMDWWIKISKKATSQWSK